MKTIAIGDLHGQYSMLKDLLDVLVSKHGIDFKKDIFVFLGDFVDGGPDVKKLLDLLIKYKKLYSHWKFLYGNHEDLMLDALNPEHPIYNDFQLWWLQGGKETVDSYAKSIKYTNYEKALANPLYIISKKHFEFLRG